MNLNETAKETLVENLTLVLLYLTSRCEELPVTHEKIYSTWKSYDWNAMDKLIENGCVFPPKCRRTHTRYLTEEGVKKARDLLDALHLTTK
ncbi:DUF6429 family protein [Turicimonas muris]|uniref:DUF6429 family protein n=1 Tax=Turicimonas muris TaxID=1796652 RepID=UPI00257269A6|nr:DUF6429 family protein [Turicimonas muris]